MIKIICVGKIKEHYLKDAITEYKKRLSKYTKVEIIELIDSNINAEAIEINKHLKEKDNLIVLDIKGKEYNSLELSEFIDKQLQLNSNLVFLIGGSDGVEDSIKAKANHKLSFSKLTFPHQLFRVFLLEQIYRSFKIANNETYHK